MEVGEETMTHLLGGGGLGPATTIEATCRKTLPGKCFTFTEVTRKRCDNTFSVLFLYAQTALRRSQALTFFNARWLLPCRRLRAL